MQAAYFSAFSDIFVLILNIYLRVCFPHWNYTLSHPILTEKETSPSSFTRGRRSSLIVML